MKLNWTAGITAAFIATGASAPMVFAQTGGAIILAQAEDEAALAEAQAILAEAGNLRSMSEDDLKERVKRARQLSRSDTLPADVNADVRASTVNGDIETDFPLTITGRFGPRRLNGTIGRGGRSLSLETVNGGIRIKKQ